MKRFLSLIAAAVGLGLIATVRLLAMGPGGGGGYGARAGTSNAPGAGHVAARYGLYTARPYNPGPTYGPWPNISRPPGSPKASGTILQTTPQSRALPRNNPPNLPGGPYYYYRW